MQGAQTGLGRMRRVLLQPGQEALAVHQEGPSVSLRNHARDRRGQPQMFPHLHRPRNAIQGIQEAMHQLLPREWQTNSIHLHRHLVQVLKEGLQEEGIKSRPLKL